jgi:hypothetical protein
MRNDRRAEMRNSRRATAASIFLFTVTRSPHCSVPDSLAGAAVSASHALETPARHGPEELVDWPPYNQLP